MALLTGYPGYVQGVQTSILNSQNLIYLEVQRIATEASNKALGLLVEATIDPIDDIKEPKEPETELTLEKMLADLEALREELINPPDIEDFSWASGIGTLEPVGTEPDQSTIVIPPKPNIPIGEFTEELEDLPLDGTTAAWDYSETEYVESPIGTLMVNLLSNELQNGSYGINPADEDALYQRYLSREGRIWDKTVEAATTLFASGGFTMPTGAAAAAIARASLEAAERMAEADREFTLKKHDQYLEWKKINLQYVMIYEQENIKKYDNKMNRLLQAASAEVESVIKISAFEVERLKYFLEKYKTQADVFNSLEEAKKIQAEIYKTEIEGVKVQVEANKALIEEYAVLNKVVVDIYEAKVKEYIGRIEGYTRKIQTLAEIYKAQASVFASVVGGYERAATVESTLISSKREYAAAVLNARVAKFKALLDEEVAAANLELEGEKAVAQNAATVAVGALGALNVNTSVGVDANAGFSFQGQQSEAENHNYNYTP